MAATPKLQDKTPTAEDPSMEEILQSIRRIIAEDEVDPKAAESVPGSDVLELTEMVKEDGSVVSLKDGANGHVAPAPSLTSAPAAAIPKPAPTPPAKISDTAATDVLGRIDAALSSDKTSPVRTEAAAIPVASAPQAMAKPSPAPVVAPAATGDLVSPASAANVVSAFNKLKTVEETVSPPVTTPSPTFSSGDTVEGIVAQMLKPMMKEWLDANLPAIVERIVEREVKRLTK